MDVVFEHHGMRDTVDLKLGIGIAVIVLMAGGNIDPYQIDRILMEVQARTAIPVLMAASYQLPLVSAQPRAPSPSHSQSYIFSSSSP